MPSASQILWKRIDEPGHEVAWLRERAGAHLLAGTAVFAHRGEPCRLDFRVRCDAVWRTRDACVRGWIGRRRVRLRIRTDAARSWWPIRRLALGVGSHAEARAAWLRFPELVLEPLDQTYRRTGERSYHYVSGGGDFEAELEVDATSGFARRYGDLWIAEATR